jgi:hypothetical protein
MGILVPETCWGNKTAYFVAYSWFFTFTVCTMHGHMNITTMRGHMKSKVLEYVNRLIGKDFKIIVMQTNKQIN